jgi:hypothetical protein
MTDLNAIDNGNRILQPKTIQTDNGTEFKGEFNKTITDKGIKQIYGEPYHSTSQGVVERMNRTIRNKILKLKLLNGGDNVWADKMDEIEFSINATYSDAIKTTPIKAISMNSKEEEEEIQDNIKKQAKKNNSNLNDYIPLEKGQTVRLKNKLKKTDKITDNKTYSDEIYTVQTVNKPTDDFRPSTYLLNEIKGKYTFNDLLPINSIDNELKQEVKYTVSRIVKPATQNGKLGYWVKFKNYKGEFFVEHDTLILDIPKDVNNINKRWNVKFNPKNKKWSWKKP